MPLQVLVVGCWSESSRKSDKGYGWGVVAETSQSYPLFNRLHTMQHETKCKVVFIYNW